MKKSSFIMLLATIILCYSCQKENDVNIDNHSLNSKLFSSSIPRVEVKPKLLIRIGAIECRTCGIVFKLFIII